MSATGDDEYDEFDAVVRVPKGARPVRSKKTDGAYRGITRDSETNELGHAEFFLKEEREPEPDPAASYPPGGYDAGHRESEARERERERERRENAEFLADVLFEIGVRLAEKAAPHVKKWWHEQASPALRRMWHDRALPAVRAKWSSVGRSRSKGRQVEAAEPPQGVVEVSAERRVTMSGTEARERFVAALRARLYSDGQLRLLRNARIVGEDGQVEPVAVGDLTPQRIGECVAAMLEEDPSLLGEDTLAELAAIVTQIRADGGRAPVLEKRAAPATGGGAG
ncbi:hypothetical protein GCM10009759_19330 [Kitasatospora saccharophila]|uniref:Uncharacterized protein n=1 Tax=Kitasatospora saccharophila TaxID=407973 RepID=A0ABN2WK75_9ACTN